MTFTKGIGTPKYMAPEVLDKHKYKKAADIYSFFITMLEIFIWEEVFQKDVLRFKFAWDIADFTSAGKRLIIPNNVPSDLSEIITKSWVQNPKERTPIENIENALENFYNSI
ncbi:protein serine/threonine kinase, putative [Entamoeba invadens IP1]|uniref:protein serine/threonine kinase, putative n=1 Tax=Entamoeba invadens IP1 TaxID=370355 RepID=UPI0002C3D2DF|nr:protein serine/threonine kinase, putative [Entamoeba invadens IP1]ELP90450.1 protein serine/threonine kinase, putative [Entamoeba invadens IP1]|eukprot:XP_004257221.1 protein serine/threonine kinase, putative [Entamoeba invadens IP1]